MELNYVNTKITTHFLVNNDIRKFLLSSKNNISVKKKSHIKFFT